MRQYLGWGNDSKEPHCQPITAVEMSLSGQKRQRSQQAIAQKGTAPGQIVHNGTPLPWKLTEEPSARRGTDDSVIEPDGTDSICLKAFTVSEVRVSHAGHVTKLSAPRKKKLNTHKKTRTKKKKKINSLRWCEKFQRQTTW